MKVSIIGPKIKYCTELFEGVSNFSQLFDPFVLLQKFSDPFSSGCCLCQPQGWGYCRTGFIDPVQFENCLTYLHLHVGVDRYDVFYSDLNDCVLQVTEVKEGVSLHEFSLCSKFS